MQDFQAIYDAAIHDARLAANDYYEKHIKGRPFACDCGFAWVIIKPATSAFVRWLKSKDIGSKHCYGGWSIWYSEAGSIPGLQNIGVHEAACYAFSKVLQANDINAYSDSRLD